MALPHDATGPKGGGGTLMFSYIRRLRPFLGFKILNFNILGFLQKNEHFLGMKILCIFFFLCGGGGHHKIGLYLGVMSMYLRVFS